MSRSESQSRSASAESEYDRSNQRYPAGPIVPDLSGAIPTSTEARAKRRIAALEEELEQMRQEKGTKQRKTTYYISPRQGDSPNDLYEEARAGELAQATTESVAAVATLRSRRLCHGCILSLQPLMFEDCEDMLRKLKKGADAARGDDTSTLKDLIAAWVN
ncbi:hypothetical protein EDD22DRAFT_955075 [Suillus occidentalis]|nr:hypothetical protein EDD22DRAFT_955075 [Suillus occidentalis]